MANFVLVHGAWHGAWCWRDVVPLLAREGHRVHPVTLPGVGARVHLLSPALALEPFVDAVLPQPGESWSSTHVPQTREARIAAAEASRDYSFPPPDPSVYGLAGEQHAWVKRRQVPHPGHTYTAPLRFDAKRGGSVPRTFVDCHAPPLATIDVSRQRVRDPAFWGAPWRIVELATGHDPMVSAPSDLARVLLGCAA